MLSKSGDRISNTNTILSCRNFNTRLFCAYIMTSVDIDRQQFRYISATPLGSIVARIIRKVILCDSRGESPSAVVLALIRVGITLGFLSCPKTHVTMRYRYAVVFAWHMMGFRLYATSPLLRDLVGIESCRSWISAMLFRRTNAFALWAVSASPAPCGIPRFSASPSAFLVVRALPFELFPALPPIFIFPRN